MADIGGSGRVGAAGSVRPGERAVESTTDEVRPAAPGFAGEYEARTPRARSSSQRICRPLPKYRVILRPSTQFAFVVLTTVIRKSCQPLCLTPVISSGVSLLARRGPPSALYRRARHTTRNQGGPAVVAGDSQGLLWSSVPGSAPVAAEIAVTVTRSARPSWRGEVGLPGRAGSPRAASSARARPGASRTSLEAPPESAAAEGARGAFGVAGAAGRGAGRKPW